ncbi:MAG: hypothetical protein ACOY16_12765 [Chloroflexota bacterium]
MNKKTAIVFVLSVVILLFFLVTFLARANTPIGKFVPVKGGEIEGVESGQWVTYQNQVRDLNLAWARIHVRWNEIDEVGSGNFDFSTDPEYANFKNAVMIANSMGAEVVVTVKGAPFALIEPIPIATAPNGTPTPWPFPCGRISTSQGTERLKLFIVALLNQIKTDLGAEPNGSPPVHYIELWNEPDAPAYDSAPDFYGCWVKKQNGTPEYQNGGIYYAQVLNAIAPYVKSQFPAGSIKFVAGATMSNNNGFLEKVIDNAIANIDVVSYHQYIFTTNSNCNVSEYISSYENPFSYIRNYLDNHGGAAKPILISEGAMGFYPIPSQTPAPAFYNCQATFAANLLTWAEGKRNSDKLLGFIWYTVATNGWRETDLLFNNGLPKPVYHIWRDFGPLVYLPLVYNSGDSSQSISMDDNISQSSQSGDPYPAPAENSNVNRDQSGEESESASPYPAP